MTSPFRWWHRKRLAADFKAKAEAELRQKFFRAQAKRMRADPNIEVLSEGTYSVEWRTRP